MEENNWQQRTELLLGEEKMKRIRASHVLVVGLGGVGAYAAEMLCRAGVGRMTIVDADTVQPANMNRQLPAMHSTLGMPKAEVLAARYKDINPDIELTVLPVYLKDENIPELLDSAKFDFIVDAIDTISPKCFLIYEAMKRHIKIVSSMGAGAKSDITQICFADLWDTYHCGLSKAVRKRLQKMGVKRKLPVVFSTEQADPKAVLLTDDERNKKSTCGTVSYMPAVFCCYLAEYVIKRIEEAIMIKLEGITKSFGSLQVLKGIDLEINKGEIVSIVGPSGAGKTTLLQIMGTLDEPDAGTVAIDGTVVSRMKEKELSAFRNKNIGFVFQFHQLLPEFTALENVMIPAFIAGVSSKEANERAMEILAFMGLTDRASHKPNELSGGEKQRVAVARALINHPAVILADEPSGSLDTHNKEDLHQLFFDLRDRLGQTFVIVTHDEGLAKITDRTVHMVDGTIKKD